MIMKFRRLISVILCSVLVMSFLPSEVIAYTDNELSDLIKQAGELAWADGTNVSRRQVKAAYDQGLKVINDSFPSTDDIVTAKDNLNAAISGYNTMTDMYRTEIGGFSSWDEEIVGSFTDKRGCAVFRSNTALAPNTDFSVMVATAGKDIAYFSNADTNNGVYGNSPFGVDLYETDGIRLWVDAADLSLVETISVSIGTRSNLKSNTFTTPEIPMKKGYVTIGWEMFSSNADSLGQSPDLSGAMNYFAVSFNGVKSGFIGYVADLHCFTDNPDKYKVAEYSEEKTSNITSLNFYKIVERSSGKVLSVSPELTETVPLDEVNPYITLVPQGTQVTMEDSKQSLYQEWQMCIQPDGTYRIVNKATSAFLTYYVSGSSFVLGLEQLDMSNDNQKFKLAKKSGGYTIATNTTNRAYFSYKYERLSLSTSSTSQVWDVYECDYGDWKEVWGDEFEGSEVDRSKWKVYESKHRPDTEPVYFRDSTNNLFTKDGNLVIKTKVEQYNGYPVTGAYLTTEGRFAMSYGKIEMRAKLPDGYWIWPALWMLGYNGNWPEQGEIDIMELVGGGIEDNKLYGTLHWLLENGKHISKGVEFYNSEKLSEEYHTYAAEWENDQLRIYFDGMQYMSLLLKTDGQRWGYGDNPHFIILNTSIRGPGDEKIYPETARTSEYYIDYIRVSKRSNSILSSEEYNGYSSDELSVIRDPNAGIWDTSGIAVSPTGTQVCTVDWNSYLRAFNPRTGELLKSVYTNMSSNGTFIKYSPKGKYLAVLSRRGEFMIYRDDEFSNKSLATVPGTYLETAEFSPDESILYLGGKNLSDPVIPGDSRYLFVYSTGGASLIDKIKVDSDIRTISASDDGKYVAVGMSDGKVVVFETKNYTVTNTLQCEGQIRKVEFLSDSYELFACSELGEIVRYNAVDNAVVTVMRNPANVSVKQFSISPDESKIVVATSSGFAMLFDANNGKLIAVLNGFEQLTSDAVFSPDGNRIAVSSYDGTIRIYDDCGGILTVLSADTGKNGKSINNVAFTTDSSRIFAGVSFDNKVMYTYNLLSEVDRTPLIDILSSCSDMDMSLYSLKSREELQNVIDNVSDLLVKSYVSEDEIAAAVADVSRIANNMERLPGTNANIKGFEDWSSQDLTAMSKTKCISTISTSASALTPNVTQAISINPNSTAEWKLFNYNSDVNGVVQNPFGINLYGYMGLKLWVKSLTKEVPGVKIYIGYTDNEGSFLYSAQLPTITQKGAYAEIPFEDFVYVSGEKSLDLSKINTIGFSGKSVKTNMFFTELTAYSEIGEMPVITGIEDGGEYDITSSDPPSAEWNEGLAYLDGYEYTGGTPITAPGSHVLLIVNKGTVKEIGFTIVDNTPAPVVSGVENNCVFDLALNQTALPVWNIGTAELNGEAYTGEEIKTVGEYKLTVTNQRKTTVIEFVVVDTTGASEQKVKLGDFDNDGDITVADALAALRIAAKLVEETPEYISIGDIDRDNHVTVADALAILRVAAKLTDVL